MNVSVETAFSFPSFWAEAEASEIHDIIERRIKRAPARIKRIIPVLRSSYDVKFTASQDILIVAAIPSIRTDKIEHYIKEHNTPFPNFYTTDLDHPRIAISMLGYKNGLAECDLGTKVVYIGEGASFTVYETTYKPLPAGPAMPNRILINLAFFIRLGNDINRFNFLDRLEETIIEGIHGAVKSAALSEHHADS